jgi:hypothetical protein
MAAEGTAERLSAYVHVLRALVHASLGRLPAEPRLDVKRALGRHAHEDARSIDEILIRLADLPATNDLPGRPAGTLADLIDRIHASGGPDGYRQFAYATVKPTLAQRLREHRAQIDPLLDEPTLELVTSILARQERHLDELPARDADPLQLELRVEAGTPPEPPIHPQPEHAAREPWINEGRGGDGALQRALSAELAGAEILARTSHESPSRPWAFHADVARLVADRMRHIGALDAELTRAGGHWGADTPAEVGAGLQAALDLARAAALEHPALQDDLTPFERIAGRWA